MPLKSQLPRMAPHWYCGPATVFWTYTMDDRQTGWLSPTFHRYFRELLLHAAYRYRIAIPAYCLMPDHGHFLLIGLNDRADQLAFVREFSRVWNRLLHPHRLARQAYDTVLRESDRQGSAFADLANYIWQNPVRLELVNDWRDWEHLGCVLPGYASLDPRKDYFRENFWKGYRDQAD